FRLPGAESPGAVRAPAGRRGSQARRLLGAVQRHESQPFRQPREQAQHASVQYADHRRRAPHDAARASLLVLIVRMMGCWVLDAPGTSALERLKSQGSGFTPDFET